MSDAHLLVTEDSQLLDIDDLGRVLGLTRPAIYNRRHRGDFAPAIKLGSSLRWRADDLASWLEERHEGVDDG